MVTLIRYANEGFKGYNYYENDPYSRKFVSHMFGKWRVEPWIYGCFIFIEEIDQNGLIMMQRDRGGEKVNTLEVKNDFKLWVKNDPYDLGDYLIDISNKHLSHNSWVKVEIGKVVERNKRLKEEGEILDYESLEGVVEYFDIKEVR